MPDESTHDENEEFPGFQSAGAVEEADGADLGPEAGAVEATEEAAEPEQEAEDAEEPVAQEDEAEEPAEAAAESVPATVEALRAELRGLREVVQQVQQPAPVAPSDLPSVEFLTETLRQNDPRYQRLERLHQRTVEVYGADSIEAERSAIDLEGKLQELQSFASEYREREAGKLVEPMATRAAETACSDEWLKPYAGAVTKAVSARLQELQRGGVPASALAQQPALLEDIAARATLDVLKKARAAAPKPQAKATAPAAEAQGVRPPEKSYPTEFVQKANSLGMTPAELAYYSSPEYRPGKRAAK